MTQLIGLSFVTILVSAAGTSADELGPQTPRTWPQAYSVERNEAAGILTLRTPYYVIEQDLKQGRRRSRASPSRTGRPQTCWCSPSRPASGMTAAPCFRT